MFYDNLTPFSPGSVGGRPPDVRQAQDETTGHWTVSPWTHNLTTSPAVSLFSLGIPVGHHYKAFVSLTLSEFSLKNKVKHDDNWQYLPTSTGLSNWIEIPLLYSITHTSHLTWFLFCKSFPCYFPQHPSHWSSSQTMWVTGCFILHRLLLGAGVSSFIIWETNKKLPYLRPWPDAVFALLAPGSKVANVFQSVSQCGIVKS